MLNSVGKISGSRSKLRPQLPGKPGRTTRRCKCTLRKKMLPNTRNSVRSLPSAANTTVREDYGLEAQAGCRQRLVPPVSSIVPTSEFLKAIRFFPAFLCVFFGTFLTGFSATYDRKWRKTFADIAVSRSLEAWPSRSCQLCAYIAPNFSTSPD